jgi:hypothetical protein
MENRLKDNIRKALISEEQNSLFGNKDNISLEKACVDFLKNIGYKVVKPIKDPKNYVKDLDTLIDFFYNRLNSNHPRHINVYRNLGRDRKIAGKFLENRIKATGCSSKTALKECGEIIRTIFDHEDKFNFDRQIRFEFLGQENMGWVTDKAIQILNNNMTEKEDLEAEIICKNITNKEIQNYKIGYNLDEILKNMEDNY